MPASMTCVGSNYFALTKFRLTLTASITTLCGFFAAGGNDLVLAAHVFIAALLLGAAANTFNQIIESKYDAQMQRTKDRPLPSGNLKPSHALIFGLCISLYGLWHLIYFVNSKTMLVALALLLIYVFLYTPMKRITPLSVYVGAISGALPVFMGWLAVDVPMNIYAWSVFLTLFIWQIPHFYVIAWMYREDYTKAGFKMVAATDEHATQMRLPTMALTLFTGFFSILPALQSYAGMAYWILILIANTMLGTGLIQFLKKPTKDSAIVYVICSALFIVIWSIAIIANAYLK